MPFNTENLLSVLTYIFVPFILSSVCTLAIRELGKKWNILDKPNARSTHTRPSPTLGGLGVVFGFWGGIIGISLLGSVGLGARLMVPFFVLTILLLPVISDEIKPWGVQRKLFFQLLIAGTWVFWGIPLDGLAVPYWGRIDLGGWAIPLSMAWLVVLCNVFNFMDGIDGIVGSQSLMVCMLLAVVGWSISHELSAVALVLLASVGGFLMYNLPPASIFLGDIGAWFLGFLIGVLGLWGEHLGVPLWFLCSALGFFLFDVFYTLFRRLAAGENGLKAHKKHLYQRLHSAGWPPLRIDLLYMGVALLLGLGAWGGMRGNHTLAWVLWGGGAAVIVLVTMLIEKRTGRVFGDTPLDG